MTEKCEEGLFYSIAPLYEYILFCLHILLKYYWIM